MADDATWPADSWMPSDFTSMASRARLQDLVAHTLRTFVRQQPLSPLCNQLLEDFAGRRGAGMQALAQTNLQEFLHNHPDPVRYRSQPPPRNMVYAQNVQQSVDSG